MNPTFLFAILSFLLLARPTFGSDSEGVPVPANALHEAWAQLLRKYVNDRGLVDYAAWKKSRSDLETLDSYLRQFAEKPQTPAIGSDAAASLINLYNATTIRWILANYPTDSIKGLKDSFVAKRHDVGGRKVSLDDVENNALRPLLGYRTHAVLVCAARSCPPLQRFAYTPTQLNEQIESAYRAWLGRSDLNRFLPEVKKIEISSIFIWYKDDFDRAGGVPNILAQYAPPQYHDFLISGNFETAYLPYNWGLNDQSDQGKEYSWIHRLWDSMLNFIQVWK